MRSFLGSSAIGRLFNCISEPAGKNALQLLHWHEHGSVFVLDQENNEFCWLGFACAPTNDMNIVGAFIKGLSWCQCNFFSAFQLHDDGTLQDVYKCVCIVTMYRVCSPGRILYCDQQAFLTREV